MKKFETLEEIKKEILTTKSHIHEQFEFDGRKWNFNYQDGDGNIFGCYTTKENEDNDPTIQFTGYEDNEEIPIVEINLEYEKKTD